MNSDVRAGKLLFLKNYITEEDLSSQITAIKTEFVFLNDYISGTVRVFLNGLRDTDFIESDTNKITFTIPFDLNDELIVDYVKK